MDRLNPVPKLVMVVAATVAVFILWETWQLALVLVVLLALLPLSRLRLWELRAATRFFVVFSVILLVIHAFFVRSGEVLWSASVGPIRPEVTLGGVMLGIDMVIRFLVVVLGSLLFVATSEPNALAHSLMRAGLPYRAGFALVLALRLMPLMRSESNAVREAQAARGLELDRGGVRGLARSVRFTLGPLLVSSLARVDALSVSMEGRAFGHSRERTFLQDVPWRRVDSGVLVFALLLPIVAALSRWGPL